MDTAPSTAGPDSQPDPDQDRSGAPMPARIGEILRLVQTLTTYGRTLSGLITRPTTWFGFVIIARIFGTAAVPDMAARIQRGIMRAMALEALLLHRAERGADLVIPAPSKTGPRKARPTTKPPEAESAEQALPLTLDNLPTQQETRAWVRRRPIGRIIAAIILDLGIAPAICEGAAWNQISRALQNYRGSVNAVMKEVRRRVDQFEAEDRTRNPLPWPERPCEGAYPVLGCFIGQASFPPAPAATAGPS